MDVLVGNGEVVPRLFVPRWRQTLPPLLHQTVAVQVQQFAFEGGQDGIVAVVFPAHSGAFTAESTHLVAAAGLPALYSQFCLLQFGERSAQLLLQVVVRFGFESGEDLGGGERHLEEGEAFEWGEEGGVGLEGGGLEDEAGLGEHVLDVVVHSAHHIGLVAFHQYIY